MLDNHQDALWRGFPKDLSDFEKRFSREQDCRDYIAQLRWGGQPVCARCGHDKVWPVRDGQLFECAACGYQTSLTAGTLFHGTRKPLKLWFRAIWEVCVHRPGISARDLQRVLGFGSYETAWTWLHKIRSAMVRPGREKLSGTVQADEIFIGGKGQEKAIVIVMAEEHGRVRLLHAPGNHEEVIKLALDREVADSVSLKTDGHAAYNRRSAGRRSHRPKVQSKEEKKDADHVQFCHRVAAHLKRWLLATHCGAVSDKHLQAYLDEFTFRYNRRKTKGVGRKVARVLENMIKYNPIPMQEFVQNTFEFRHFQNLSY